MASHSPFLELAAHMASAVRDWPRRKPGVLVVDHKTLRYADLHSLYHQIRQIYGEQLYAFSSRRDDPRIIDCGAHVGVASLFFKERYPAARITAFEADAAIADMCRANLKAFGHADVTVTHAAVWTHENGVNFAASNDDAGHVADAGADTGANTGAATTPSVRLKALLAEGPVDLLKLDVEGAEFAIVADCGASLAVVDRLVIELHAMDGARPRIGALLAILEAQGFRYVLGDLHQARWLDTDPTPFSACATARFIITVYAWRD